MDLEQALARGRTVLTANQRAARAIAQAFNSTRTEALWTPAKVMPLEAWLASEWRQRLFSGQELRVLLNRTQEHVLWRGIIDGDTENRGLRSPDALARIAARAWSLACTFKARNRLRESAASAAGSIDTRTFARWCRAFERRLERGQWITAAELPASLAAADDLATGSGLEPNTAFDYDQARLLLVDFDSLAPAVRDLLRRLPHDVLETAVQGGSAHLFTASSGNLFATPAGSLCIAGSDRLELEAAAHWCVAERTRNPAASIAIVVPNLADRRAAIERVFAPILAPDTLPITAAAGSRAFEFSLGRPLAEVPLALAAKDLLIWPLEPLPLDRISALLRSGWLLGPATDDGSMEALATFDAYTLRKASLLRPELALSSTISLMERAAVPGLEDVLQRLRSLRKAAREHHITPPTEAQPDPDRQSFAGWADAFRSLLDACGWNTRAQRDSLTFQQHRRWESTLDELATLDFDGSKPSARQALAALERILEATVFAPETHDAPVQILGPLELGGVGFDALWFVGADDLTWPAPVAANPLLPWQVQRVLGMPGADRMSDDRYAHSLTARIAGSAATVVFSYAERSEEGERRPSPLLASLGLCRLEGPVDQSPPAQRQLEPVRDDTLLPPLPASPVRGGAQVLKLQAACGFRAFAERRLWSSAPESRQAGFDALERGNLVHKVMEHLWIELESHGRLKALSQAETAQALDRAIAKTFGRMEGQDENPWESAYLEVQRLRLRDLLLPWLVIEGKRPPFEVQRPEQDRNIQLGPLTLKLRIDRIDSTARGEVIVDYKTGHAVPAQWQGERPDEPQLPLYAVLTKAEGRQLAGVAFASLRAGDGVGLKGYADDDSVFGKTSTMEGATLEDQVERWQQVLVSLAEAFAAGDSRVLPKLYPKTCKHCAQRILCRLDPASLGDGASDEDDDGAGMEADGEQIYG